jgi:hypothetical protein
LIGDRAIFRRERAVGLSATAYLVAKVGVFGMAAVIQSAVLVLVVTAPKIGKHAPSGATALGSPMLELFGSTPHRHGLSTSPCSAFWFSPTPASCGGRSGSMVPARNAAQPLNSHADHGDSRTPSHSAEKLHQATATPIIACMGPDMPRTVNASGEVP